MVKIRKIPKKKLKEPDEFLTLTQQAFIFITHHLKQIVAGVILVLIIALAIFVYFWWERKKEAEAYQKFGLAVGMYQMVNSPYRQGAPTENKQVLEKFNEVISEFGRTSSGKLSFLYKGNIHLRLEEFDEAIKAYQDFLKKGGMEKLLRQFALEGVGYAYEGKKDYANAAQSYQKILAMESTSLSPNVYLGLGRCYEKLGKNKEAIENYKVFLKANQKSIMANVVLRKISNLEK